MLKIPFIDGDTADSGNRASASISGQPVASPVPLLTGFNAEEGFPPPDRDIIAAFEAMVRSRYGASADKLLALYPHQTELEAAASWRMIARDRYMASLRNWLHARSASTRQTIFAYVYAHPYPARTGERSYGAFHTSDIPFVFVTFPRGVEAIAPPDAAASEMMAGVWAAFITGRPLRPDGTPWPAITPAATDVMQLGSAARLVPAVSSPERYQALLEFVEAGGQLSMF